MNEDALFETTAIIDIDEQIRKQEELLNTIKMEPILEKTIIDGEDTSILLKNIESKLLKEKKEMDNQVILSSLILRLLNIKNKEKNIVTYNNDYEPYQYEEEELEEDDYYYEDNK